MWIRKSMSFTKTVESIDNNMTNSLMERSKMSERGYMCEITCCHFLPKFDSCKFWLDYNCGFCDKTSLNENLKKFCPIYIEQNDFQGKVGEVMDVSSLLST